MRNSAGTATNLVPARCTPYFILLRSADYLYRKRSGKVEGTGGYIGQRRRGGVLSLHRKRRCGNCSANFLSNNTTRVLENGRSHDSRKPKRCPESAEFLISSYRFATTRVDRLTFFFVAKNLVNALFPTRTRGSDRRAAMEWITRKNVELDRVSCPRLIPEAQKEPATNRAGVRPITCGFATMDPSDGGRPLAGSPIYGCPL